MSLLKKNSLQVNNEYEHYCIVLSRSLDNNYMVSFFQLFRVGTRSFGPLLSNMQIIVYSFCKKETSLQVSSSLSLNLLDIIESISISIVSLTCSIFCRKCGVVICQRCSTHNIPLPRLGEYSLSLWFSLD